MRDFLVTDFKYGIINAIEPQSIPSGASSDSMNWMTKGDKIELSRGSRVVGTEIAGIGRVTGIHTSYKADGTEVYFCTYGKKVYTTSDATNGPWTEVGTDMLGTAASGEDVEFSNYATNAGAQCWLSSPNSGLFKIMTANPTSYTDMYNSSKNFKGYISVYQNRMWLWGRKEDKTGVYGSYIDNAAYTIVTAEARHNGDGATKVFSGTLSFKGAGATRTCFDVTITDGTETFTDDYNGVLTGSAGGTGTINYTTGGYSVTFAAAPVVGVNNITATYQWEDSNNKGISDFTKSDPRLAGEGFIFRQDDGGGKSQLILPLGNTMFCFHEFRAWALTLTNTDTNASNDIYRHSVGIPSHRAAVASSVGIFYIDVSDKSKPRFRKLILNSGSSDVIPDDVTTSFDFSGYLFDDCEMKEWNDYIVFSAKTSDSNVNNVLFLYHKIWKSLDVRNYYVACTTIAQGVLLAGESISNNVVTLFSGFDDSDALIDNYWKGDVSNLRIPGNLKRVKMLTLEGEIQSGQTLEIYVSTDRGSDVLIGEIDGDGPYVDKGQRVLVGSSTIGSKEIGGGGDGVEAFHYLREIHWRSDKFDVRRIKYVATGIGYVSVTKQMDHDVRLYSPKVPSKYRI